MIPKPRYRWPDPKPLTSDDATGFATVTQGVKADSAVQSVVAGTNVTVDNTDPRNPVVSSTGGGGGGGSGDALRAAILADSPRAYYPMDGANVDTVIHDLSANARHITCPASNFTKNSAPLLPGVDTELYPTSSPQALILPSALGLTAPMNYSYSLCTIIRNCALSNYGFTATMGQFLFLGFYGAGEAENANWQGGFPNFGNDSTGFNVFWEYGAGANVSMTLPFFSLHAPVMIHCVKNSSNKTVRFYRNGSLVGAASYTNEPTGTPGGNISFSLGDLTGHWAYFDGALSDARIIAHAKAAGMIGK